MRNHLPNLRFSFLISLLVTIAGCKKDDLSLTPEQKKVNELAYTWQATNVTLNDTFIQGYDDFSLNLTDKLTYTVSGGPNNLPFPPLGSWELGTNITNEIIIDSKNTRIKAQFSLDSNSNLTVEFNYSGSGFVNGRINELDGSWAFTFKKN
jgi:hypothetical protein